MTDEDLLRLVASGYKVKVPVLRTFETTDQAQRLIDEGYLRASVSQFGNINTDYKLTRKGKARVEALVPAEEKERLKAEKAALKKKLDKLARWRERQLKGWR